MSEIAAPAALPPVYWLIGLMVTVGVPALSAVAVALVQRPVRRDARQANRNSAVAARRAEDAAQSAAHAATELTPNHGSSTKDQATRMELVLAQLATQLAEVKATGDATNRDVGGLREEIRTERRERLSLAERLDDHIRAT